MTERNEENERQRRLQDEDDVEGHRSRRIDNEADDVEGHRSRR